MGSKKNVDMSSTTDTVKIVEAEATAPEQQEEAKKPAAPKVSRSQKYRSVRSKIDKTKEYSAKEAVELVKKLSYSNFTGTITADAVVKETGIVGSLSLPHSTGKQLKVVIVDDKVLGQLEAGNIDFDALVSSPEFMPKLAKYARTLGPKGLMPNPKIGTLTPNPEAKKKELESGKISLRTDKKQPLLHVSIGKTDQETAELVENLEALIRELGTKLQKLAISATMSPGIRVDISGYKKKA